MIAGLMAAWPLIKRFWWIIPLVGLVFTILIMKADISAKAALLTTRNAQVADLTKSNKDAADVINRLAAARIDNDAIAEAVASKVGTNTVRETHTNTIIERAGHNDPKVHDWLSEPIPASVRGALQAH